MDMPGNENQCHSKLKVRNSCDFTQEYNHSGVENEDDVSLHL